MILKDAFRMLGMSPRIEFLVHGTVEHRRAGRDDSWPLFCDIAPDAATVLDKALHPGAIVLDHHVGARALVEAIPGGVYADAETEPGVSGAVLAFREVWEPVWRDGLGELESLEPDDERLSYNSRIQYASTSNFAACIGVRDTWQTNHSQFQRGQWLSKALMCKPASHWLRNGRFPYLLSVDVEAGRALFEAHEEAVRQAVGQIVGFNVGADIDKGDGRSEPVRLVVFQEQATGFRLCSDLAERLRAQNSTYQYEPSIRQIDVVAGFSYVVNKPGEQPRLLYSLRGLGGFDVQRFATANGGGGHKAAAGFSASLDGLLPRLTPYELVRTLLEMFLVKEETP
jgi:hypothetical protein